jgi:hypothetical protein
MHKAATRTIRSSLLALFVAGLAWAATTPVLLRTARADDDDAKPSTRPAAGSDETPRPRPSAPTTRRGPGGPGGNQRGAAQPESIGRAMGAMGRSFATLRKQIKDSSKNESSLAAINELQRATAVAKGQLPPMIRSLPKDDQAKSAGEYRTMMHNLLKLEVDLEDQLLDGKNDKAAETLDQIDELQNQGHKEYRPKEGGN